MIEAITYKPKQFPLSGLQGISDKTLEMHFKLYEGYVKSCKRIERKDSRRPGGRKSRQRGVSSLFGANAPPRLRIQRHGSPRVLFQEPQARRRWKADRQASFAPRKRPLEATIRGWQTLPQLGKCVA